MLFEIVQTEFSYWMYLFDIFLQIGSRSSSDKVKKTVENVSDWPWPKFLHYLVHPDLWSEVVGGAQLEFSAKYINWDAQLEPDLLFLSRLNETEKFLGLMLIFLFLSFWIKNNFLLFFLFWCEWNAKAKRRDFLCATKLQKWVFSSEHKKSIFSPTWLHTLFIQCVSWKSCFKKSSK